MTLRVHEVCVSYSTCSFSEFIVTAFVFVLFCVVPNCMSYPLLSVCLPVYTSASINLSVVIFEVGERQPSPPDPTETRSLSINTDDQQTEENHWPLCHCITCMHTRTVHIHITCLLERVFTLPQIDTRNIINWFNNCIPFTFTWTPMWCHYIQLPAYIMYLGMKNTSYKMQGLSMYQPISLFASTFMHMDARCHWHVFAFISNN